MMASTSSSLTSTVRILSRKWKSNATFRHRPFSISATFPTLQDSNGDAPSSAPPPTPHDQNHLHHSTPCPPWQNPLHHENPAYTRVFHEEFSPDEEIPVVPLPPVQTAGAAEGVLAPPHVHQLADEIVNLNMREVAMLMERIGGHFGFDGDDGGVDGFDERGGGAGEAAAAEEEAKVEQTAFDLKLAGFDAKSKIKVIKEIRGITNLGLKEAKELVEGAPTVIK
ncbi:hypothetical protein ACHAXS_006158, partial [Conticribra weissflogii]